MFVDWLAKINGDLPNMSVNRVTNAAYPCCVLDEIITTVISSAENRANEYETRWQISLYSKDGSHVKIIDNVNNAMVRLGFKLYDTDEFYTDNTKIIHKILKYSQTICDEEFQSLIDGFFWE